jgi:RNA 2',3'-cyclic 3'-phosphodiesterase
VAPASPESFVRLFLGLWPDDEGRASLLAHAQAWDWPPSARRTRPERLHVTLHFIGDVAAARLPELRQALQVTCTAGELTLDRPTVWPGGIAVLEAQRIPPELAALHAGLGNALRALDLPVESRPWRPHVTLARKAFGAHPPMAPQPVRWSATPGYVLVESLPGGRGYEPVATFT